MARDELHPTPGLKRMKRHNGRVDFYWCADPAAIRAGFTPKTARLPSDWTIEQLSARCLILQAEMRRFAVSAEPERNASRPNTLGWLCRAFETDKDSPFHEKRRDTRLFYSRYLKMLVEKAGEDHLRDITGRDVRRWYAEFTRAHGERSAYACVQTLRRAVAYGCELRNPLAYDMAQMLERMAFTAPKARKVRPTYEQVQALRAAAHEAGRPSIALAVVLQFELGLRQKDVIGEWEKVTAEDRETIEGAITSGNSVWSWGLMWNHIDPRFILRKPTSKSNGTEVAEHDLRLLPDVLQELGTARGVGPVVIDERSGLPWKANHFSRTFRKIARSCGWPDEVWNMDSRAGAVTEGFAAGAEPIDMMRTATHTQLSTTLLYNRDRIGHTSRVHELRAKSRQRRGEE